MARTKSKVASWRVMFAERVRAVVRAIPRGKTMSYGEVAYHAGRPRAARAVGTIMANNSDVSVPCHRVIRADGHVGGYNSINGPSKAALLRREGIDVDALRSPQGAHRYMLRSPIRSIQSSL